MASIPMTDLNLHPNSTQIRCQHQRKHHGCRAHLRTATVRKGNSDVKHTIVSWIVPITSLLPPLIHIRHRRNCVGNYEGTGVPSEVDPPLPNLGRSHPEDSYIGVFIQMLGLYSDPLDREQAVNALWKYALGGRQCVDNIMKFSGCINLIVNLLKSNSPSSCEAAAGLLQSISSVDIYRKTVAQSGAIEEITGVLLQTTLTPEVIERCVFTLNNLSIDKDLGVKIAKSDLLPVLIKLLDHELIKVKESAGGLLANLALSQCNHNVMVEAGVIPMLAKLLKYDVEGHSVVRKEAKKEADFSPQQLAVVSALCEWRDNTARAEDESTGFILPNKTLLEIARHMPDSNNKLRRFIKSKNSFVECYMVSVVHIIKTSILNAYAFEEISEELKRAHRERLADQNSQTVHEEFRTPQTAMSLSSQIPSTSGHLHYTSLLEYGSSAQPIVSSPLSSIGHNMGNESSASLNTNKVNVASIQVLKKPNGPFGALLGNSKKKISDFKNKSTDQEKTEKKLLQIKSSVRLPFHSFSENLDALSIKPILSNENPPPPELQQHDTDRDIGIGSNLDDIIPLKSDESENDSIGEQKQLSPPQPEILDLSTTCHGTPELSLAQEKTNNVPFEPFDYEAARKEMNLEEELASEKKNDDSINNGNRLKGGSRKFKQTRVIGKGYQEETADFEMPKRRQAFPASGNRSATFPD